MRNKFGWSYPPGAANDPNAPYNQTPPPECPACEVPVGRPEDHADVGNDDERFCLACHHYWTEAETPERCPECGDEDIGGLPCPNSGKGAADLEEDRLAAEGDAAYDAMREKEMFGE